MNRGRGFLRRWPNVLGALLCLGFTALAAAAPLLAPEASADDSSPMVRRSVPKPPSWESPLGTLRGGVDVYHGVIWGARSALRFGLAVTAVSAVIGVTLGATAGYAGGWAQAAILRLTDAFLTFPVIATVWLFQQVLLPVSFWTPPAPWQAALMAAGFTPVMASLMLFSWMPYARLAHIGVVRLRQAGFIQAAEALGAAPARVLVRHLLPNALAPVVVLAARDIGGLVMLEAAFTFIGVGGASVWGSLLSAGRDYVIGLGGNPLVYWWTYLPATVALVLFGLGWNLLGDGLTALLDPRAAG